MSDPVIRTARLTGPRPRLDPRNHVAGAGLVDIALADRVAAARYVAPQRLACVVAQTPMRGSADAGAMAISQLLFGESFDLFDTADHWGFGQSVHDGYTGWVPLLALGAPPARYLTRITAALAPVFAAPDIKSPILDRLPFGARISGDGVGNFVALADGGHVHARHIAPAPETPLAVARLFAGAPYVWGGRTPQGVDCSGLVQAALAACGIAAPRDSDQQRDGVGQPVAFGDRTAGDLVFFPGHVGILVDADTLFHANAHWMTTGAEPLADVIARVTVSGVRRL